MLRSSGTVTVSNSLLSGNTDSSPVTGTVHPNASGTFVSLGYNLLGTITGTTNFTATGDVTNTAALLSALANNGGPTLSQLPQPGSQAIDTSNGCSTTDQRNYGRAGSCDKGAVEYNGSTGAPYLAPQTQAITKTYYYAGAQLIALRVITSTASTLYFLHTDHLGSSSLTTDASGNVLSRQSYYPYGSVRVQGDLPTLRTFTGQYTEEPNGLGSLMFYNARYYSPLLGRFVSADTIVPGMSNPQAFNRYTYVLNSPLNYQDPTGDYACGDGEEDEECDGSGGSSSSGSGNASGSSSTPVNTSLLTTTSSVTGLGGAQMYWLYMQLWNFRSGWWWNTFGADGTFDVWDFAGLMMYYEGNRYFSDELIEGAVRAFWGWCETVQCSGNTPEALLNWIGMGSGNMKTKHDQAANGMSLDKVFFQYIGDDGRPISSVPAQTAANRFRNPPASWQEGWDFVRPYWYGNFSLYPTSVQGYLDSHSSALWVYVRGGDAFFVPSGCVWTYWLQDRNFGVGCPSVR